MSKSAMSREFHRELKEATRVAMSRVAMSRAAMSREFVEGKAPDSCSAAMSREFQFVEVPAPDSCSAALSMSREEWPPQWKPIEQSPESFFMGVYLQTKDFETNPSLYPFGDVYPYDDYMTFLKQIRESRGYDVTISCPEGVIQPIPLACLEDSGYDYYIQLCGYLVEKINDRAKMHGEFYAFHSLVKLVEVLRDCLLTFDVKEVQSNELKTVQACIYTETYNRIYIHGWRFKPSNADHADHPTENRKKKNRKKNPKKRLFKHVFTWKHLLKYTSMQTTRRRIERRRIERRIRRRV